MKLTNLVIGLLTISSFLSCSLFKSDNMQKPTRLTASRFSEDKKERRKELFSSIHLNYHFRSLFHHDNPVEAFLERFKDHLDLYYHNQAKVMLFDRLLDEGVDPLETDFYLSVWEGRDENDHGQKVLSFYLLALQKKSFSESIEMASLADDVLTYITDWIWSLEDVERVAFIDIISLYDELALEDQSSEKSSTNQIQNTMKLFSADDFNWTEFYENHAEILDKKVYELHDLDELYEAYFSEGVQKRARFYPSASREGNVFGNNFPRGVWALTYDDGPARSITVPILDLLEQYRVPATFFWLANRAGRFPDIINRAHQLEMELANHSYSHARLTSSHITHSDLYREIINSTFLLEEYYGTRVRFFRLPEGAGQNTPRIREMIASRGLIHAAWNVDSLDWQDRNPQSVLRRVQNGMRQRGGGIILFHDIQRPTITTTRLLLDYIRQANLRGANYQFQRLGDIVDALNNDNSQAQTGPILTSGQRGRTTTYLNVRLGPSARNYRACTVLPPNTEFEVLSRHGGFLRVRVRTGNSSLIRDLNSLCGRDLYISGNLQYIEYFR